MGANLNLARGELELIKIIHPRQPNTFVEDDDSHRDTQTWNISREEERASIVIPDHEWPVTVRDEFQLDEYEDLLHPGNHKTVLRVLVSTTTDG